jgi:hypothetical protein
MGEQGGSYETDRQRGNYSPENGGIGPVRRSPESDPGFIDEQVREKKDRLNNANENGNPGFQGWCSSTSRAAIPVGY